MVFDWKVKTDNEEKDWSLKNIFKNNLLKKCLFFFSSLDTSPQISTQALTRLVKTYLSTRHNLVKTKKCFVVFFPSYSLMIYQNEADSSCSATCKYMGCLQVHQTWTDTAIVHLQKSCLQICNKKIVELWWMNLQEVYAHLLCGNILAESFHWMNLQELYA